MIATDAETTAETVTAESAEIAQPRILVAGTTETTTTAIAEEDRATAQGKGTDHDLQNPSDEGTQIQNRHLLQSRVALYHHKMINSVAK